MSILQFLKSNELDNSYSHTIDFDNITKQNEFWVTQIIDRYEISISTSRLLAQGLYIDVGIPYKDLVNVNYLRIYQDGKHWYFFINDKQYINENSTHLVLEMDVMQTFMFDYEIEESFVEREHENRYNNNGKPIFSLTNENLDYGESLIKKQLNKIYDNVPEGFNPDGKYGDYKLFWLNVITREPLSNDESSVTVVSNLQTNIYYYVAPIMFRQSITIGSKSVLLNKNNNFNTAVYGLTINEFLELTQDPKVISISITRYSPFDYEGSIRVIQEFQATEYLIIPNIGAYEYDIINYTDNPSENPLKGGMFKIKDLNTIGKTLTGIDLDLDIDINELSINNLKNIKYEPKLYHKDYFKFVLEIGTQKQPLDVMLRNSNEYKYLSACSIRDSHVLAPENYASDTEEPSVEFGLKTDSTTLEIPLRTDAWLTYLSQNKNSLVTGIVGQTINAGLSVAGAFVNPIGVLGAIQQGANLVTNIASTIGKVKDIQNTPDTLSIPNNDYVMAFLEEDLFFKEKIFEIAEPFKMRLFNYFYTFGYMCNNFKKPNLKSRYYFNFIKILNANIKCDLNNDYVNKISNIYQNGITFWHYRNADTWKGTLNYNYENVETELIGG